MNEAVALRCAEIALMPFDADQAEIARRAFGRYGKGRHPAGLNFGDCFAYALSKASGEPLLHKGGDFGLTDVDTHWAPEDRSNASRAPCRM